MKHNFFLPFALFIFFLVFLFTTINSHTSAGSGAQVMKMNKKEFESVAKMENPDSLEEVMGVEYCEKGDEECLNRRMAAEAHLDYIYTQHQRP